MILVAMSAAAGHAQTSASVFPDAPRATGNTSNRALFKTESGTHGAATHGAATPDAEPESPPLDGTQATVTLLSEVSSKLPNGASFQARLDQPLVKQGRTLLPQGAILPGHLKTVAARRPMRPGSVFMVFDRVAVPGGPAKGLSVKLLSQESDAVNTGGEGELRPAISKKRLALQLGGTYLTAKLADDLAEAAGGTAIGAGTARWLGAGAATAFFLWQRGREVRLKAGDRLTVEFGR